MSSSLVRLSNRSLGIPHFLPATIIAAVFLALSVGLMVVVEDPRIRVLCLVAVAGIVMSLVIAIAWGVRVVGTLMLVLAVISSSYTAVRITSFMTVSDVFLIMAATILLPRVFIREQRGPMGQYVVLVSGAVLVTIGGILGTIVGADSRVVSLIELAKFLFAIVMVPLIFYAWNPSKTETVSMLWIWVFAVGFDVLIGVLEIGSTYLGRVDGLTLHPNTLGLSCVFALGPALSLALSSGGVSRWMALVGVGAALVGTLISGSRAAIGGVIVTVIVFVVLSRRIDVAFGIIAAGVLSVGILLSPLVELPEGNALARLLASDDPTSSLDVTTSNSERAQAMSIAIENFSEHPITGVGFEGATEAHNIYVQIASAGGLFAIGGFVIIVSAILFPTMYVLLKPTPGKMSLQQVILVGLLSGYIGYLASGLFNNSLWERYLWIVPALMLTIVAKPDLIIQAAPDRRWPKQETSKPVLR